MSYDFPAMHSLYGRALGVTPDGYPTSEHGWKNRVAAATSATTGTALKGYGINTINLASSASPATFTMDPPNTGVSVSLSCISGSSGIITITMSSSCYILTGPLSVGAATTGAVALSSASSAYSTIHMSALGQNIDLVGISTNIYFVKGVSGFSTASTGAGALFA
jgi:hypothetical protein